MDLPPPPGPHDLPERPTKPLGPVLTRSMIDIRLDIAEIQSRHSRANCKWLCSDLNINLFSSFQENVNLHLKVI